MSSKEQALYDKIERYLLWQMSEEERAAFEVEIAQNPDLAEQVEAQGLEHRAMDFFVEEDLLEDIALWRSKEAAATTNHTAKEVHLKTSKKSPFFNRRSSILAIAAASALLVVALFWLNQQKSQDSVAVEGKDVPIEDSDSMDLQKQPSEQILPPPEEILVEEEQQEEAIPERPKRTPPKEQIAKEVKKDDKKTPQIEQPTPDYLAIADAATISPLPYTSFRGVTRGGGTDSLDQALDSLDANKMAQGITILEQLIAKDKQNKDVIFHLGLAQYEQGDYEAAIPNLEKIVNNEKAYLFKQSSRWMLSLAYLRTSRIEQAKALLKVIAEREGHDHRQQAKELLEKLG